MPHFQTAITRMKYADNLFFKAPLERATLHEHDSVYFIKFLIKKPNCLQGFLKGFDLCALTGKTGQYKMRLA